MRLQDCDPTDRPLGGTPREPMRLHGFTFLKTFVCIHPLRRNIDVRAVQFVDRFCSQAALACDPSPPVIFPAHEQRRLLLRRPDRKRMRVHTKQPLLHADRFHHIAAATNPAVEQNFNLSIYSLSDFWQHAQSRGRTVELASTMV